MFSIDPDTFRHEVWPWLLSLSLLMATLLYVFRREDRRSVVLTLGFLVLGLFAMAALAAAKRAGISEGTGILHEAAIIQVGLVVIRLWGLVVFRLFLPMTKMHVPRILEDIIVMLGYAVWGLWRMREGGVELSHLVLTSTIITAVIGFSMQDTLGNLLSGLAVQLDDSIKIGQWIKIGDVSGKVIQVGWRSTLILNRNGETTVLPNSWLMKNGFQAIGQPLANGLEGWRRWVWFELNWNLPPLDVTGVLERAILDAQIQEIALEPPPQAVLMELKHGVARYALRYWLTNFMADDATDSRVRAHALAALRRHGMELTTENFNIATTKENERVEEIRAKREISRRLDMLGRVALFSGITAAEREQLAPHLRYAPFEAGDIMSREGAVAHWLYLIINGKVDIWRGYGTPGGVHLGTLGAGEFFGEMGMMTGAPRTATVVAGSRVECYRLDRDGFEAIISARPEIAEEISRVLAKRQAENVARNLAPVQGGAPAGEEMLVRIRKFFGV
ncbi:mechanosensitive ion channel family protein [Burkholderiaceae bacterium DAT-1]|nr:mechanosensitive ion channel family protein [Burkholderiaceae bacterium DAT-1]